MNSSFRSAFGWTCSGLLIALCAATPAGAAKKTPAELDRERRFEVLNAITQGKCGTQAMALLSDWKATPQWIRGASDLDGGKLYKTPTDATGTWVEVSVYPDRSLEFRRISPELSIQTSWLGEQCQPRIKALPVDDTPVFAGERLVDKDLDELRKKSEPSLVYVWSPHMILSMKGFKEASQVAAKYKMTFVPVLDPGADPQQVELGLKKYSIPQSATRRLASVELSERGVHHHYPAVVVVNRGRFSEVHPGLWENQAVLERFVQENLK